MAVVAVRLALLPEPRARWQSRERLPVTSSNLLDSLPVMIPHVPRPGNGYPTPPPSGFSKAETGFTGTSVASSVLGLADHVGTRRSCWDSQIRVEVCWTRPSPFVDPVTSHSWPSWIQLHHIPGLRGSSYITFLAFAEVAPRPLKSHENRKTVPKIPKTNQNRPKVPPTSIAWNTCK
jgi:hypothetical protein